MVLRALYLFSLLISFVQGVFAQEELIPAPSESLAVMPFQMLHGGVVIVKGKLPEFADTLNFILDTGSGGISLDSTTILKMGLHPTPSSIRIRGVAGVKAVSFLLNRKLDLGGYMVDSLNFHINDYSFLSAIYGLRIDGIIGYSIFSRYIVKINYDDFLIEICSPGTIRYPKGGYLLRPYIRSLVVQDGTISDRHRVHTRFLHDIGAGVCLMLSKGFVSDSSLLTVGRKRWPKQGHGLGGKIDMDLTIVKDLRFGPYRFKYVPTLIFDDEYDVTSYPYLGGLIGNDIFRRFNTIYNYANGDIYLMPNKAFRDRFDYAYSGLDLQVSNDGIEVGGVAEKSPAALAGAKEGDILLAIDNDFSMDFAKYKKRLQRPNKKVSLLIRRNQELHILKFKIKNIRKLF